MKAIEVLGSPHRARVLLLLRERGPIRFNQIQDALDLNPAQVDRVLKLLHHDAHVMVRTLPAEGSRVPTTYELSKTGRALVDALDAFVEALEAQASTFGRHAAKEMRQLYPHPV